MGGHKTFAMGIQKNPMLNLKGKKFVQYGYRDKKKD
jgi:hypothetical protein